ncbi:DUF2877 domain-containing protein [Desulfovibrio cuneatus]|uniref:DUF2877 domain-containing protein n=1 Tax=Desulfovibrio cuneatus TaxID=159728 RepID=UPI00041A24CE|nr:DUF2877 domain-containing protein [Desulfovibrio cuneatus]
MLHCKALSADARLLEALHQRQATGVVLSVFTRAMNVLWTHDGVTAPDALVALVGAQGELGPNVVQVDASSFEQWPVAPQAAVQYIPHCLHVGRGAQAVVVDMAHAQPWQQPVLVYPQNSQTLQRNLTEVLWPALEATKPEGEISAIQVHTQQRLRQGIQGLAQSLVQGDEAAALTSAKGLLGLGMGLTPAGDDMLLGLFAVCTVCNCPLSRWQPFFAQVAHLSRSATNVISSAGVEHAAHGRMRASLAALVHALMHGSQEECRQCLELVLDIGSSSGRDMAVGMAYGCAVCLGGWGGPEPC